ncbi:MAG: AraC family transcriptional regulator [Gammaproteobacteria bacterium]|nr:AraC family transcriptional regulator [Gammaproteobacteria bacterium]MDH5239990.1 AraC family transcriptional regulator [Gammaproteobacteria bacterium]MDH5260660.1 AraC family transcriptional regulator [Gammaproteobacteria bacterium]MDH5582820.1 AraC family transcriptional regulator [Gammaproteobacteria bacterium]
MIYGDEYYVEIAPGFDLEELSTKQLSALFANAHRLTRFNSTPDQSVTHDPASPGIQGLLSYRIDIDRLIDINDAILRKPIVLRNELADVISFQFVSTVKRSEILGKRRNVHDLGPALIVSVVPGKDTTYRVPKINVDIRHVVVNTTLSNLLSRMRESGDGYPAWLLECLDGRHRKPRQQVFFLEDVHRDSIWSCFHLPVAGSLLGHWMSAKFDELLCIGLQILKNSQNLTDRSPVDMDLPHSEKIRRARAILSMEYANPPPIPKLAQRLGISETRLKSGFRSMNGTTVMQYCINKRIDAARLLLKENRHSIAEIGSIVGYDDPSAFSRAFRRYSGQNPREWRRSYGS